MSISFRSLGLLSTSTNLISKVGSFPFPRLRRGEILSGNSVPDLAETRSKHELRGSVERF